MGRKQEGGDTEVNIYYILIWKLESQIFKWVKITKITRFFQFENPDVWVRFFICVMPPNLCRSFYTLLLLPGLSYPWGFFPYGFKGHRVAIQNRVTKHQLKSQPGNCTQRLGELFQSLDKCKEVIPFSFKSCKGSITLNRLWVRRRRR